jgi:hypothetical protein
MKDLKTVGAALLLAGVLPLPAAYADTMSKGDYAAGKTRIGAAYKADVSACATRAGNAKDICVREAKALEVKALADAKMGEEIGEARRDAAADKNDADCRVALEKCDAFAGDAKGNCVADAKAKFGER